MVSEAFGLTNPTVFRLTVYARDPCKIPPKESAFGRFCWPTSTCRRKTRAHEPHYVLKHHEAIDRLAGLTGRCLLARVESDAGSGDGSK